jgi:ABC-type transport system involved in cytochrome c biogenesis permease component
VALLIPNDSLNYVAYQVLGQWPEGLFPVLLILWFVAMLLFDSQGKTRILGFVALSIAVGFELYTYTLAYLGTPIEEQSQILRLLMLPLFVWLLFESTKKTHLTRDAVPSLRSPVKG